MEAWIALTSGVSKSLEYAFVTSPIFLVALPALGIPATVPQAVIHSPHELMGMGIPNLWESQGLVHVDAILCQGTAASTITGHQLHASFEVLLLEVSLSVHSFDLDYTVFEPSLMTILWDFLSTSNFTLWPPNLLLVLNCEHDVSLLQIFADLGFCGKNLYILNPCRKYLSCRHLSDIVTGDGQHICYSAWNSVEPGTAQDSVNWPVEKPPTIDAGTFGKPLFNTAFFPLAIQDNGNFDGP